MHESLERIIGMGTIDDGTVGLLRVRCLCSQLATEELVHLTRITMQTLSDGRNVGNGGLNPVAGTLDFSKDGWHPVTVFRIIDGRRAGDVDDTSSTNRHGRRKQKKTR